MGNILFVLHHLKNTQSGYLFKWKEALDYFFKTTLLQFCPSTRALCSYMHHRHEMQGCLRRLLMRCSREIVLHSCRAADVSWILSDWEDELDALRNAEALPSEQHSSGCHSEEEGLTRITVSAEGTVSPAACVYTDFSTIPELNQCIHEAINGTEVPKLMTFSDKGAQQSPKCIYFNPEGVRMH